MRGQIYIFYQSDEKFRSIQRNPICPQRAGLDQSHEHQVDKAVEVLPVNPTLEGPGRASLSFPCCAQAWRSVCATTAVWPSEPFLSALKRQLFTSPP